MYNTVSISYAFREDPATIIVLEDGGVAFRNAYQITAFRRKLIRPSMIDSPLFFCDNDSKYAGKATDIINQIFDYKMSVKYDYAVVVDSQVEFNIDYSVLDKLSKEYMPAQNAETYQQYFSNYTSGVIVFCRVFKIDRAVIQKYLFKGKQGSAQVIRLYDEFGLETSIDVGGFVPVLSDSRFEYIKDEIIHYLKTENVFITSYQNNSTENEKLDARLEAEKAMNSHRYSKEFDDDLEMDMAQLDYDLIFDEVIDVCPSMKSIIDQIRTIQAARYNEASFLLSLRDDKEKSEFARQRLYDMHARMAVKNALYFHKKYGVEIEDAFQEASVGIFIAINKYNTNVQSLFATYVSTWIFRIMHRNLPIYQYNVRMPVHYKDKILPIVDSICSESGCNLYELEWNELMEWIQLCSDFDEEEAKRVCSILIPYDSIDVLLESDDVVLSDNGVFIESLDEQILLNGITMALGALNDREREIIESRNGFCSGAELTLADVGKLYGLTRERIRQIEIKAILKIKRYIHAHKLFERVYPDFSEDELYPNQSVKKNGTEFEKKKTAI